MINPISSGSFMGVRKRMMVSAPIKPRDRGRENCIAMKRAVIEGAIRRKFL